MIEKQSQPKLIGAGRSGKVFLVESPEEDVDIARKVFDSDRTANLVHYVFSGAPNPYTWSEDAIRCAFYRRRILQALLPLWFGNKATIADALGWGFNKKHKAYQLDTAFRPGRPIALCQPFSLEGLEEYNLLLEGIMKPLQQYLQDAGFDGIVWQAGKGNPVALNNFLLMEQDTGEHTFVGIDIESGVPALFAMNPLATIGYYLPMSNKHGEALFDDVDAEKLAGYLETHRPQLEELNPEDTVDQLLEYTYLLGEHQKAWRSLSSKERLIRYQLIKNRITNDEADTYRENSVLWYTKEGKRFIAKGSKLVFVKLPLKLVHFVTSKPYLKWLKNSLRFVSSEQYRLTTIRSYITRRVNAWVKRDQLTEEQGEILKSAIDQEAASDYLNDFSVHLSIKLAAKIIKLGLVPALLIAGVISEAFALLWFVAGGPVYRTIYTIYRMVVLKAQGKPLPWIALFIGVIPMIGDVAFPCQLLYTAGGKRGKVARFILYDSLTRIGAKIPIWGGEDTQTEHVCNHLAYRLIRAVEKLH
jgi:hypothetical protein